MNSQEIKALTDQYILNTYGRFPVAIDHGKGATLWDVEGKEYIDFTSGIGVCSLGYGNEAWVEAIAAQAAKLGHISNLFYSQPYAKLAHPLCERTGMAAAFFANSGAESNEGIIKLARKYSFNHWADLEDGRSVVRFCTSWATTQRAVDTLLRRLKQFA